MALPPAFIEPFQSSPLCRGVGCNALHEAVNIAFLRNVKRGEHLLYPGDHLQAVYVVLAGWVKIYRLNEHGNETITCLFNHGDVVLADLLYYDHHPSPVGVEAETNAVVAGLPVDALKRVLLQHPQLAANLMECMASLTHDLMYLVEQITAQPAVERVSNFLLKVMLDTTGQPSATFILPFEKIEIAHYLGLAPETLSRCLKTLADRGIEVKGRSVVLQDPLILCANCDPVVAYDCKVFGKAGICRFCKNHRHAKTTG